MCFVVAHHLALPLILRLRHCLSPSPSSSQLACGTCVVARALFTLVCVTWSAIHVQCVEKHVVLQIVALAVNVPGAMCTCNGVWLPAPKPSMLNERGVQGDAIIDWADSNTIGNLYHKCTFGLGVASGHMLSPTLFCMMPMQVTGQINKANIDLLCFFWICPWMHQGYFAS